MLGSLNGNQVLAWSGGARLAALLGVDGLFCVTTAAFLAVSERFGHQRYGPDPKAIPAYPGPWLEASGAREFPKGFKLYVMVLPFATGVVLPLLALVPAFLSGHGTLAASALLPYMVTLFCQIGMEKTLIAKDRASPMWPMVPVVHMLYRLWQLPRSIWLVSALAGPQWLLGLLYYLIVLWLYNFGCVMAWMPWLYHWHRQSLGAANATQNGPPPST
ncbi:hypothetical protein WJX72_005501 [[Myrmecia] bisecta]|uniref:Uncharacterized protein n=1 Tax=[Myrmecia] bisecta TaxID=41462 RepID=A0AAW1R6U1_9CHLO